MQSIDFLRSDTDKGVCVLVGGGGGGWGGGGPVEILKTMYVK